MLNINLLDINLLDINIFKNAKFNIVVTVCDQAREACPYFPGGKVRKHKSFTDPSEYEGKYEDKIKEYRRIRDEIKNWIEKEFG